MLNCPVPGNTLQQLNQLSETFYLTGSRFFGVNQPESDWDFFCPDSQMIRDFLHSLGFRIQNSVYKSDPTISAVFRKYESTSWIDVQLLPLKYLFHKISIQDSFKRNGLLHPNSDHWYGAFLSHLIHKP